MNHRHALRALVAALALSAALPSFAHCDGLDGPVVDAARRALDSGDPAPVLSWVQKDDEAAIAESFRTALAVRKLGPEAKRMADTYFFETLVRVHRAGEGEPYTGLKPAGRDLGPAIPAADKALATGNLKPVEALLSESVKHQLHRRFEEAASRKAAAGTDVNAAREYVAAYVQYLHAVERIYEAANAGGHERHEAHAAR